MFCRFRCRRRRRRKIGRLRNDDDDSNENGTKEIGLDKENNNFARATRFFVHFFVIVVVLQSETAYFPFLSRTGTKDNNLLFLFLTFDAVF